ncbi:MAG TPA: hypothetical protein PLV92_23440, partial [Pirellulaceae bacterium]|nr:hypothetical protein [Pirellulaceae bacterium]
HRYRLRAEGVGYNPAELELALRVEPPRLEVQPPATTVAHLAPGTTATVAQRVRMLWLAGGALEFSCAPADRLIVYDSEAANPVQRDSNELPFRAEPAGPWLLRAFTPADSKDATSDSAGWTTLRFTVRVPKEVRRGRYDGALELRFEENAVERLKFGFLFDGLKTTGRLIPAAKLAEFVEAGADPELLAPRPTDRFDFTCCFDQPSSLRFVIGSHVGRLPIDPKLLEVAFDDRVGSVDVLRRAGSKRDYVAAPRPVVRGATSDQMGVVIELQFPEVGNATPGEAYSGKLSVRYRGEGQPIDLGTSEVELNVRFIDAAESIRVSTPKP